MAASYSIDQLGTDVNILFLSTDGKMMLALGWGHLDPLGIKPKRLQSWFWFLLHRSAHEELP